MYETYWRLKQPAFDNDLAPEFYFPARSHQGALLKLRYLIEHRKGMGLVVGDHGVGKTFLTYVLERELQTAQSRFIRVVFPLLTPAELLRYVALQFGVVQSSDAAQIPTDVVLSRLEGWLINRPSGTTPPVLVVDDAHLLEPSQLQTLQFLLNLGRGAGSLSLLLLGRAELLPRIKRVPALADRVAIRTVLQPLPVEEVQGYVSHRLKTAGLSETVLQPGAVQTAWELSRGYPRTLNQVCDLSLLVGYAEGLRSLSQVEVQAAAEELTSVSAD